MQRTDVYYVVPADGDQFEHPNVFTVKCSVKKLTLSRITKSFPIPGRYHFRFKMKWRDTYVWLDVTEPSVKVPLFEGKVCIKAARIRTKTKVDPVVSQRQQRQSSTPAIASDDEPLATNSLHVEETTAANTDREHDDTQLFNLEDDDSSSHASSTHATDGDGDLFPVTPEMKPVKAPSGGDLMGDLFNTSGNSTSTGHTHVGGADDDELSLFFQ